MYLMIDLVKNSFQSFKLPWHIGSDKIAETLKLVVTKVSAEQLKIFIEGWLS
jgi:hypothetical protein